MSDTNKVYYVRLLTGEELLAQLSEWPIRSPGFIKLIKPALIQMVPPQNPNDPPRVHLMPWPLFTTPKSTIQFNPDHISFVTDGVPEMVAQYTKAMSNLILPQGVSPDGPPKLIIPGL